MLFANLLLLQLHLWHGIRVFVSTQWLDVEEVVKKAINRDAEMRHMMEELLQAVQAFAATATCGSPYEESERQWQSVTHAERRSQGR